MVGTAPEPVTTVRSRAGILEVGRKIASPPLVRSVVYGWAALVGVAGCLVAVGDLRTGRAYDAPPVVALLAIPVVGALITRHRPRHPVGWIFLLAGSAMVAAEAVSDGAFVFAKTNEPTALATVLADVLWPLTFPLISIALLWFPDGRLPSRRWRPVAAIAAATTTAIVVESAFTAWGPTDHGGMTNPLAIAGFRALLPMGPLLTAETALAFASIASVPLRYRRCDADARQRIRWVLWAAIVSLAAGSVATLSTLMGQLPAWTNGAAAAPAVLGIPICVGIAIIRSRLLDIDILLSRTLLYFSLSFALLGIYVATVTLAGIAFASTDAVPPLVGGLVIAVGFHPLRTQAQRLTGRWLYGDRDDPLRVLATVAAAVTGSHEPYQDLITALATSLRLHHVAIDLAESVAPDAAYVRAAEFGSARGAPLVEIPIAHDSEPVGRLVVAARSTREPFRAEDLALLRAAAGQAGATITTQRLAAALQRSRERIVQATAAERRRLGRDLHDGIGARLTAIGYSIEAATRALPRTAPEGQPPSESAEILSHTKADLVDTVTELRRVIDALRPAALDDLGLVEAIDATARHLLAKAGVSLTMHAFDHTVVDQFEPAAEVAFFRIAIEAVNNVIVHAAATTCSISLVRSERSTTLTVHDDGIGVPSNGGNGDAYRRDGGIGIGSMRERAEELGGTLTVEPDPEGGTTVRAIIPSGRPARP